jgi:cytosolic nonspecific dipeptidase
VEDYRNDIKTAKLVHNEDKIKTLMARWRYPSLSLHGIQGAFSEPGSKTVIPRKVIGKGSHDLGLADADVQLLDLPSPPAGKFSVRIVPDQTPEFVEGKVVAYLKKKWAERGSTNCMKVSMGHGGRCWVSDPDHPNYLAGRKATKMVYGVEPDLTREGVCV